MRRFIARSWRARSGINGDRNRSHPCLQRIRAFRMGGVPMRRGVFLGEAAGSYGGKTRMFRTGNPESGHGPLASLLFILLVASLSAAPAGADIPGSDLLELLEDIDSANERATSLGAAGYQKMLEDFIASAAACKAGKMLRARMRAPALYAEVEGACIRISPAGPALSRYFSDPACTRELDFSPASYSAYCREMVAAAGPNTRLGNAASWRADEYQANDPAPGTPGRKWTVAHGTQLAFSSEAQDGKTVPFMKRLRYREVVTPSDARPLYWSCADAFGRRCAPVKRPGHGSVLLGYIKESAGPGAVPLYWACVPVSGPEGGCTRRALVTKPSPYGGSLLGYLSRRPVAGTLPLYWRCSGSSRSGRCAPGISPRTAAGKKGLLGYLYDRSIIKGSCALEMRVYKKDADASGLTPLLAFHGGSWRYRGAAFVGFEAQLAHYTEDGFIVFVPFYRLAGDADGNRDCNGAPWRAITADAEAALDWVVRHAAAFGAASAPPAVMGQSAGAHLAGWLLAHRSAEVSAGLLFYGPSDVRDFLAQTVPAGGQYHERYGASLDILSRFFGSDVRFIDLAADTDFVRLNSYHDFVRAGGVPPVFLIHGSADALIPPNQSVLMCNAYGGSALDHGGGEGLRAVYACGGGSLLHLFEQGGHGLDGCLRRGPIDACPAGDESGRRLVVESLREARAWLRERADGR